MKTLRTRMVWRLALFMGATYALAVSADEILTDEPKGRFHSPAVSAPATVNGPAVSGDPDMIDPRLCDHIAGIDRRSHAEYVPGVDVAGKPVVPADAYMSGVPAIQPQVTFDVPLKRKPFKRHAYASAGQIDVDTTTGVVAYNGEPLNPPNMSQLHEACLKHEGGAKGRAAN